MWWGGASLGPGEGRAAAGAGWRAAPPDAGDGGRLSSRAAPPRPALPPRLDSLPRSPPAPLPPLAAASRPPRAFSCAAQRTASAALRAWPPRSRRSLWLPLARGLRRIPVHTPPRPRCSSRETGCGCDRARVTACTTDTRRRRREGPILEPPLFRGQEGAYPEVPILCGMRGGSRPSLSHEQATSPDEVSERSHRDTRDDRKLSVDSEDRV